MVVCVEVSGYFKDNVVVGVSTKEGEAKGESGILSKYSSSLSDNV